MSKLISRENAEALIKEAVSPTIFQEATKSSFALSLMRKLPNMSSKRTRMPVLDLLPMTYWVGGDTGQKGVTKAAWDNVFITAAEIATIVPIPEAVLEDADYDIIGEIKPLINEAMGVAIDEAIVFGINRPNEWDNDIITLARNAGNVVTGGVNYANIMGVGGLINKVEMAGKAPNGFVGAINAKAQLREIVDTTGRPLFRDGMQNSTTYTIDGAPAYFPENGAFDTTNAVLIAGAWNQAVYSMRQDVTYKILTESVIQDSAGNIVYNLAQQDMIALRVVMRIGWALPNAASRLDPNRVSVPFAYIEGSAPSDVHTATVKVTEADGTTAIKGATVEVAGVRKKTLADGTAELIFGDGQYVGKVKADGYVPQTLVVTVAGDDPEVQTIQLVKNQ